MNNALMFSNASDEWSTPQDFYDALHAEFHFTVDAAATTENTKCSVWFGPGGVAPDALALTDWRPDDGARAVFLNPPYSKCRAFIGKAAHEARAHGLTVVCLVPSRTDTRWWHDHVWNRARHMPQDGVQVRFHRGRLRFGGSKDSAPFPSVVIVFKGR